MSSKPPPSALEQYLRLPPETALTLLTGTLGCTVNWLTAQHIAAYLSSQSEENAACVHFVSWLRDEGFWKTELRRTTGLDISRLKSFTFTSLLLQPLNRAETQDLLTRTLASSHSNTKTVLILDQPDLLLATASTTAHSLNTMLLHLRSLPTVHSCVVICNADLPLISGVKTPMEIECASFITMQAHAARLLMGVRGLETGAARDVSGVLRVTRGGGWYDEDHEDEEIREKEVLYLVQRDGGVKVFERGADF